MKRTIENCSIIKLMQNEGVGKPLIEVHQGKKLCQGYEGSDGDPYVKCKTCKVSIYSLEVQK